MTFTTVVYGDSNNDGIADFAVALIGTKSIAQDDFVTAAAAKTAAAPSMAYTAPLDFTSIPRRRSCTWSVSAPCPTSTTSDRDQGCEGSSLSQPVSATPSRRSGWRAFS
jgi:hypothetical protein